MLKDIYVFQLSVSDNNNFQHCGQHERAVLCSTREMLQVCLLKLLLYFSISFTANTLMLNALEILIPVLYVFSKDNAMVKELFDNIEKLRAEFESIERPNLELENPTKETDMTSGDKSLESVANSSTEQAGKEVRKEIYAGKDDNPHPIVVRSEQMLDPEAELAKLESEFGNINQDYSTEEIGGWEFDELERELRSGDSPKK